MAFKLVARNVCPVKVKGVLTGEDGKPEPFDFTLVCARTPQSDLMAAFDDKERSVIDFVRDRVEGWSGVKDQADRDLPFSREALDQLLEVPGVARLAFDAYLLEQQAREKN